MKRQKQIGIVLSILLAVNLSITTALAYFTTYVTAKGGYAIELEEQHTTPHEDFVNYTKKIVITADPKSAPVYVRAKVFVPEQYTYECSDPEHSWNPAPEDYWYYNDIIASEEYNQQNGTDYAVQTSELNVFLNHFPAEHVPSFHVIVVYEYTPIQYTKEGKVIAAEQADWSIVYPIEGGTVS